MSREHTPKPGVTWDQQYVRREQVIDTTADTWGPDGNLPQEPRLNREQRRAMKRAQRKRGR